MRLQLAMPSTSCLRFLQIWCLNGSKERPGGIPFLQHLTVAAWHGSDVESMIRCVRSRPHAVSSQCRPWPPSPLLPDHCAARKYPQVVQTARAQRAQSHWNYLKTFKDSFVAPSMQALSHCQTSWVRTAASARAIQIQSASMSLPG